LRSWDRISQVRIQTGISSLARPQKTAGRSTLTTIANLLLPGRSIYSSVLGLDRVGRGFVAPQRARKKTKAKEETL
jgi:hypothetical protein